MAFNPWTPSHHRGGFELSPPKQGAQEEVTHHRLGGGLPRRELLGSGATPPSSPISGRPLKAGNSPGEFFWKVSSLGRLQDGEPSFGSFPVPRQSALNHTGSPGTQLAQAEALPDLNPPTLGVLCPSCHKLSNTTATTTCFLRHTPTAPPRAQRGRLTANRRSIQLRHCSMSQFRTVSLLV